MRRAERKPWKQAWALAAHGGRRGGGGANKRIKPVKLTWRNTYVLAAAKVL